MTTLHATPLKARNRGDKLPFAKEKQSDNSRIEKIIVTGDEPSASIEVVPSGEFFPSNAKVSPTLSSKTALTASVSCEQRTTWSLSSNSIQTLSFIDDDEDLSAHAPPRMIQSYTSDSFSPVYELSAADGKNIFQECRRHLPAPGNTPRFGTLSYKTSLDFPDDENSITEYTEENRIPKMPEPPAKNKVEQTVGVRSNEENEEEENLDAKVTPKITNQTYRSNLFKMKVKRFARSHLNKHTVTESNIEGEKTHEVLIQGEKSKVQHASLEQNQHAIVTGEAENASGNMGSLQEESEKTSSAESAKQEIDATLQQLDDKVASEKTSQPERTVASRGKYISEQRPSVEEVAGSASATVSRFSMAFKNELRRKYVSQQSMSHTKIHNKEENFPGDNKNGDAPTAEKRIRTKRFARTHLAKIALSKEREMISEDKKLAAENSETANDILSERVTSKDQNTKEQMLGLPVFHDEGRPISTLKTNVEDAESPTGNVDTNIRHSEALRDSKVYDVVDQMKQLAIVGTEASSGKSSLNYIMTSPETTKTDQREDTASLKEENNVVDIHRLETTEAKQPRLSPALKNETDAEFISETAGEKSCLEDSFSKEGGCKTTEDVVNIDKAISAASGHEQCEFENDSNGTALYDFMQKSLLSNLCQVALHPEQVQKTCLQSFDGSLLIQVATETNASTQNNKQVCVPNPQIVALVPVQNAFLKCLLPGGDVLLTKANNAVQYIDESFHNASSGCVDTTKTNAEQSTEESASGRVQVVHVDTTNASAERHIQKNVNKLIRGDNFGTTKNLYEQLVEEDSINMVRQRKQEAKYEKFRYSGELGSLFDPALGELATCEENEEDATNKPLQSKLTKEILDILEGGDTKRKKRVDDEKSETCASESTNALLQDKELLAVMKLTKDGEDASLLFPTFSYDSMYDICDSDDGLSGEMDALSNLEGHLRTEMEDALKLDPKLLRRLPVISPIHTLSSETTTTTSCSEAAGYLTDTTSVTQETASTREAKSFRKVTFNDNVQEYLFISEMCELSPSDEQSPSGDQKPRVPPGVYEATVDEIISIVDDFLDEIGSVCTSAIGYLPKPSFPFNGSTHCS